MIELVLPDIEAGVIAYLQGKTIAGDSVMDRPGRASRPPYLLCSWEGDIQEQHNTSHPTGRITTEFYGRSPGQAKYGARQVREAFLTPGDSTGGVHEQVRYYDEQEEVYKTITLSGARLESGPREGPDEPHRIITTYLVDYF